MNALTKMLAGGLVAAGGLPKMKKIRKARPRMDLKKRVIDGELTLKDACDYVNAKGLEGTSAGKWLNRVLKEWNGPSGDKWKGRYPKIH